MTNRSVAFTAAKNALLAGRYEFERPVGEGGMGAVWRARDLRLQCPVAVKVLYHDGRDGEAMRQRFLREARVAAAVQHANVVRTTDFGIEDGTPYMVMELVEGESLADRMGKRPSLSIDECVEIASSVLRGLAAAHDAGVIHRDVKPENVHLVHDRDGIFPKILDFGIASALRPEGGRISVQTTQSGGLVGTPHYMSPEQARGLPDLDARSDIYSVGSMLYEMLTGATPVDADHPGDLLMAVVKEDHLPAVQLRPEIGEELSHVLDVALRKDRDERYPTARAMRQALLAAAPTAARVRPDVTGPIHIRQRLSSIPPAHPTPRDLERTTLGADELLSGEMLPPPAESRARRPLLIASGILVAAVLVGVGVLLGSDAREPEAPPEGGAEVDEIEAATAADTRPVVSPLAGPPPASEAASAGEAAVEEAGELPAEPAAASAVAEVAEDREPEAGGGAAEAVEAAEPPPTKAPIARPRRAARARMRPVATPGAMEAASMEGDGEAEAETPAAFRDLDY